MPTTSAHIRHVAVLHGCDVQDQLKGSVYKRVQSGHDMVEDLGGKARVVSAEIVQDQIEDRSASLGRATLWKRRVWHTSHTHT